MKIIILFVFVVLSLNSIYPQNAIYDAGLIKKNKQYYTDKIEKIVQLINSEQYFKDLYSDKMEELKNLKIFFETPFDKDINNLNLNVLAEFKNEFDNLRSKKIEYENEVINLVKRRDYLKEKINEIEGKIPVDLKIIDNNKTAISKEIQNLEDSIKHIKINLGEIRKNPKNNNKNETINKHDNDTTELNKKLEGKELDFKKYSEYRNNSDEFTKIENSIKDFEEKIKNINAVLESNFSKFDYSLTDAASLSVLGKSNLDEIPLSKINTGLKMNESVAIDVIFNSITEQMSAGLVNLFFDNILESTEFNLKNELRVFFPETISLIVDNKNYNLNKLNYSLRKSFDFDLSNILVNMTNDTISPNYIRSTFFKGIRVINDTLFNYLKIGITLTDALKNNFHPSEVISILSEANFPENDNLKEYQNYLRLINILQKNLRDTISSSNGQANIWVKFDKLEKLLKIEDENTPKTSSSAYFVASLYHQLKKINPKLANNFYDYFEKEDSSKFINRLKGFNKTVKSFLLKLNTLENNIKTINSNPENVYAFYTYLDNLKGIITCLKDSDSLIKVFSKESDFGNIKKNITEISKYIEIPVSVFKSSQTGEYFTVVPQLISFYAKANSSSTNSQVFKEVIKYSDFAVDLINAKSQDDLSNAVRKAVGKYGGRARKEANNTVLSINSYPGIGAMMEIVNGEKGYGVLNPGLTVPLGINMQLSKKINFALFIQVFDLTAVANFHLKEGNKSLPETVTFEQIISPGVFLSFQVGEGFGFNLGASYTPKLRSLDKTDLNNSKSLRYGVNFVYDVPLWHIY